jgi:hypothetical protein
VSTKHSPVRKTVGWTIWALAAAISVAWFVEAFAVGRGFISRYLAPFGIVGNLVGAFMIWNLRGDPSSDSSGTARTGRESTLED